MKQKIILLAILLLGFVLRVSFINSSPPSLYGDELTIVLDANSLMKTGHDQLGNFLPLTFPMGAGRPAGYVYFSIPFVALFGPTAIGVRLLSILSGLGIILLTYLLCRKLFSEKAGMGAAFLIAISPWDISLSRGGFEAHFALFLALLGVYLLLKAREKPALYLFSAICFGLTIHTYPTYKITMPLLLFFLIWFVGFKNTFQGQAKKYLLGGAVILVVFGFLSVSQTFIGGSETRFFSINVFSNQEIAAKIEQKINLERSISHLPPSLIKYIHNKPVEYLKIAGENYLQNFSADFLFLHGDRNPRHNMATIGEFYLVEWALILIGLVALVKQKRLLFFLIIWIIISPLATAIIGEPHALRSNLEFVPLSILSALGFLTILNWKNKIPFTLIILILILQVAFFLQKLYFLAPTEYANFWAYPAKQASEVALENKSKYQAIFLSDQIDSIEFGFPVYANIAPLSIINQNLQKTEVIGHSFKKFDNVYIGFIPKESIDQLLKSFNNKALYIGEDQLTGKIITRNQ